MKYESPLTNKINDITLKCGIYLGLFIISLGVFTNPGSASWIKSVANEQTDLRTSLKYLLIVSPECWNLSRTSLLEAPKAIV